MSAKKSGRIIVLAALVWSLASRVQADKLQLQEKLNADVEIELENATIGEALEKIGQKAGVKFVLSDEAKWKLPDGEATRLSVTLGGSLADSMTEMLNAFFMRYAVGDEEIKIYPRAELGHILGRPNTRQLELLKKMYGMKLAFEYGVAEHVVANLLKGTFEGVSFVPYYMSKQIYTVVRSNGSPTTLPVLLEQAGQMGDAPYWYLSGMDFPGQAPVIRVVDEETFREAKLDQVIDMSFKNESADVILRRLAGWAGMELVVDGSDPSWLKEEIGVNMQNVKLRQALGDIANSVGGAIFYDSQADKMGIQQSKEAERASAPKKSETAGGYVGKISIPMEGGKYVLEFMLWESDLPDELKRLRDETIRDALSKLARDAKFMEALKKSSKPSPKREE